MKQNLWFHYVNSFIEFNIQKNPVFELVLGLYEFKG